MTRNLIVFDKDKTLVRPASGDRVPRAPQDQQLLAGIRKRIEALSCDDWMVAIASNQGGVADRHKTLEDAIAEMKFCLNLLPPIVSLACFCPDREGKEYVEVYRYTDHFSFNHFDDGQKYGGMRKPQPGMLLSIADTFGLTDSQRTRNPHMREFLVPRGRWLMVGDRPEDQAAAQSATVPYGEEIATFEFQWAWEFNPDHPSDLIPRSNPQV